MQPAGTTCYKDCPSGGCGPHSAVAKLLFSKGGGVCLDLPSKEVRIVPPSGKPLASPLGLGDGFCAAQPPVAALVLLCEGALSVAT